MNETLQELMREATRLTQSGNLREATQVIQRALGNVGRAPQPPPPPPSSATSSSIILDGCVFEVEQPKEARPATPSSATNPRGRNLLGGFNDGSHTHASLSRRYKLYSPPSSDDKNLPLVVMLHG